MDDFDLASATPVFSGGLKKNAAPQPLEPGSKWPTTHTSPRPQATGDAGMEAARAAAGEDAEKVWKDTGWYLGKDGKYKFEIPDEGVLISDKVVKEIAEASLVSYRLKDVLKHPALYKAYPKLADTPIIFEDLPAANGGYYDHIQNRIHLNRAYILTDSPKDSTATLLHEVQHLIQEATGEDFAVGTSMRNMDKYNRSAGEAEANNVTSRYWSWDFFKDVPPAATEDPIRDPVIEFRKDTLDNANAVKEKGGNWHPKADNKRK